jgi:anti-anti-sigma factor
VAQSAQTPKSWQIASYVGVTGKQYTEFRHHDGRAKPVVIDLSGVERIDAAGLGALISVALTAQASQCSIKLAAPGNLICQLLELTNLTSVFEVHPTLDAATVASRGQAA